jgi:hypothetical protein
MLTSPVLGFLGTVLAGIAYDNEIRGVLVVLTATAILMGSVYLLLSTNLGGRLGFQVALAALFGWLMLLGLFWWMYGKGAVGNLPHWRVEEANIGDISDAQLEEARALLPDDLPDPEQILEDHPEVAAQFDEGDEPTLPEIAALPDLPEDVADQLDDLPEGWTVIPQSDLGDAQTAADEYLTGEEFGRFTSTSDYVVVGGFERGGKPERESDSMIDRIANRITNTLRIFSPAHYAIVQVQTSESTAVPPGSTPLSPTPDPDEPVVSVILVRDLGSLRLPPALLTVFFGLLFGVTCYSLHTRDERARRLSAPASGEG